MQVQQYKQTELGEIPEEWKIDKLGNLVDILVGFPFSSSEYSTNGINLIRGDNITEGKLRWGERTRYWREVTPQLKKYLLQKDDFLIGMDGSKVGKNYAIFSEDFPCLLVQRVACLRIKKDLIQNYLSFVIGNKEFVDYVESTKTNAAIPHISSRQISDFKIRVPSIREQKKIATILSNVDSLIRKTDQVIEQTQRLKKGLMQRLLTKGITHTRFRETELGEIPEEWSNVTYGDICNRITYGFTNPMPRAHDGPWLITAKDIKNGKINYNTAEKTTVDAFDNKLTKKSKPKINNILITKDGTLGQVAIVDRNDICINQSVASIEPNNQIIPEFLALSLQSPYIKKIIDISSPATTIRHIYISEIPKWNLGLPGIQEQQEIVSILQRIDSLVQNLKDKKKREESLKKALMQQLLTGKIRVRVSQE